MRWLQNGGDQPGLTQRPDGFVLRRSRVNYSRLVTLKHLVPEGTPPFDTRVFRDERLDLTSRD